MTDPILEVENLSIEYKTSGENVRAVTDVSFKIHENEYYGLVGESGSGKSTIAKAILRGMDDNAIISEGSINFQGQDISSLSENKFREKHRWTDIALIPQASMDSLDPIRRVSDQAIELCNTHTDWSEEKALSKLKDLFEVVGLAKSRLHDYPYQFSGGMQQRAVIALSLIFDPKLIVADEPTTALDVIMQDQILHYFNEIKDGENVTMLMITHDIPVILENCDSLGVLHAGQLCETGPIADVFENPTHPYTYLLKQSLPDVRDPDRELTEISGDPPELREDVNFCTFADRCPWAESGCRDGMPDLKSSSGNESQFASCIRRSEMEQLRENPLPEP
jgi:oligopeptide/dipeptide ABC transporter ATP-binding protein